MRGWRKFFENSNISTVVTEYEGKKEQIMLKNGVDKDHNLLKSNKNKDGSAHDDMVIKILSGAPGACNGWVI